MFVHSQYTHTFGKLYVNVTISIMIMYTKQPVRGVGSMVSKTNGHTGVGAPSAVPQKCIIMGKKGGGKQRSAHTPLPLDPLMC